MPFPISSRQLMLDALTAAAPYTGTFQAVAAVSSGVTASASGDTINKTAHGLSNGDLVIINSGTGGTGLVVDRPYFVIGSASNTFQLSHTSGGTAVDITVDYSAVTYQKFVETSGGSPAYARVAIAWNATSAATGVADDSTNGASVNQPATNTVDAVGLWSASTAGTLRHFKKVTQATDSSAWVFQVTDVKLDLNAVF